MQTVVVLPTTEKVSLIQSVNDEYELISVENNLRKRRRSCLVHELIIRMDTIQITLP